MQSPFVMEKNIEKLETVQSILDKFSIIMYHDTTIIDGSPEPGKINHIDRDRQIMCYYLYLHQYLVNLLRDGMFNLSEIYNDPKNSKETEARSRLLRLFQACYSILMIMVKKNPKIQKKLFNDLHVFIEYLRIPVGQEDLICEIFRDNKLICSSVKDNFLKQFLDLIITEGRQVRFLKIFEVIQSPCGNPLPEIQRMVLLNLLNPASVGHICYMNQELTGFTFEHMKIPPLFSSHYKDEPFAYHAILIKIFSLCGQGASGVYLTEAKCQKIISVEQIFELLNNNDQHYEILQIPVLHFFFHIYLDSEHKVEELESSKNFNLYLIKMTARLRKYVSERDVEVDFFEIWIKILHAYSEKYIQSTQSYSIHTDADHLCGYLEVLSVK